MHRQFADIAAGKEDGVDHIAVGGEGESTGLIGEDRAVFQAVQGRVVEMFEKELADQLLAGKPPLPWSSRMVFASHYTPF